MRLRRLTLLAGLFLAALPLMADSTTYTYMGEPFTVGSGAISGSFTVASPLGDNLSFVPLAPTSYSFSDGSLTLSSGDPLVTFDVFTAFSTDKYGNITGWSFSIGTADSNTYLYSDNLPVLNLIFDSGSPGGINGGDPGTWSSSALAPVPEPSALVLLGTGLLGLVGAGRRSR